MPFFGRQLKTVELIREQYAVVEQYLTSSPTPRADPGMWIEDRTQKEGVATDRCSGGVPAVYL